MSDEADVEELLENFQKALDTLNNIGNFEALITKLDANKNRRLLKKVKHVVSEVHSKVGTVKEKVSKAYKRVKIRTSSESENLSTTNNTDKDASDRDLPDQSKDTSKNNDDEDRYSPILGRKGKKIRKRTTETDKSQKNKDVENTSLETSANVNNGPFDQNNDTVSSDQETSLENDGENKDNTSETGNISSGSIDNQVNAGDSEDQADKITDDENKEKDNEDESSQEVIDGTPVKPIAKISVSLRRMRFEKDDSNIKTNEGEFENLVSDKEETLSNETEKSKKLDAEGEKEESTSETNTSNSKKDDIGADKGKSISDNDEAEADNSCKKLLEKNKEKNDLSDDKEEKLSDKSRKTNKKNKKPGDDSDNEESEILEDTRRDKLKESKKSRRKEEEFNKNNDDEGEESNSDMETSKKTNSRKTKHKEPRDNSDSDESETLEYTARNKSKESKKLNHKKDDLNKYSDDEKEESNSDMETSKKTRSKKNRNKKHRDGSGSDEAELLEDSARNRSKKAKKLSQIEEKLNKDSDDEKEESNSDMEISKKTSTKKNNKKHRDGSGSDEAEILEDSARNKSKKSKELSKIEKKLNKDTADEKEGSDSDVEISKTSKSKKDKTSSDEENHVSDSDEAGETDKTSKKSLGKKHRKKNKKKDSDISDDEEDTLKDKPKKSNTGRNKSSKHKEKFRDASDSDETEKIKETAKQSRDESDNLSDDEEKNKQNGSDASSDDEIITIEDTPKKVNDENDKDKDGEDPIETDASEPKSAEVPVKTENEAHPPLPKIKLVDISKLLAPHKQPLEVNTPSPKTKKSVTFDSSVIILSSSDEETPKKDPKTKGKSPLKSAMRKSLDQKQENSDSDSKENNENLKNRRTTRQNKTKDKVLASNHSSEDSDFNLDSKGNKEKSKNRRSTRHTITDSKIVISDGSSDDSDFENTRKSRRLKKHELSLKDKFSKLAAKYGERRSRAATRRLRGDDERSLDKEESKKRKKRRENKDKKKNSDSDDDSENDSDSVKARKRRRKKDVLETSSLSEQSNNSDSSDFETSSKKKSAQKSNLKKAKVVEADKNDPKFKTEVFISLPLFKCEELPEIYKRKKEIFEVKKLTKMDFTRRTRSARNGSAKSSDDSDKPDKKRIKLTLKLNREKKQKKDSSDEESTEEDKDKEVDGGKKGQETKNKEDEIEEADPLDVPDRAVATAELADACLEQITENSDKEEGDKPNEKSDGDEDSTTKKKSKNKDKESGEEGAKDSEEDKDKDEEPTVNGVLSNSEEENGKNEKDSDKDKKDESSDEDDKKKKKGKNWKKDKLLQQKIDSSDSDDDFANYSKKKDKTNSDLVRKAKKRMKKSTVISDSDSDEEEDKDKKKKKKKKGKGSDSDDDDYKDKDKSSSESGSGSEKEKNDSEEENDKKKPSRKRIKRVNDSSSDDDDRSTRKHLRKMIDRDSLSETTKRAAQEEKERKSRILEKQKKYNQIFDIKADATVDKVVLDFDEKTDEPLLSVCKKLAKQLKPHQVHGVKFMWDACFESLARLKKDQGSGCILAHCMGLGKTLQVITLCHTLLKNSDKTKVEKILVVCPVNTVLNWKSEFKKWLPKIDFEVYELVSCKTSSVNHERSYIVREWHENGGVLIIGYNMFRTLSNPENKTLSKKLRQSFQEGFVEPGPDLVVCDEGHLLKNEKTHLSIAMNRIKTPRRIVLTGTPLQNNLKEYWCMVQFIKPNLLGTYKEYMNRFVNPIINGQYTDSTQHDIIVMRRRSHVLHKLLDGVVQRQDYSVLEPYLPPKYEYVLFLTLTEVQIKIYKHYMENFARQNDGSNRTSFLFTDFQQLQRMCTHPRVLLDKSIEDREKRELNDDSPTESEGSLKDFIDDDESEAQSTSSSKESNSGSNSDASIKSGGKKKKKKKEKAASSTSRRKRVTRAQAAQKRVNGESSDSEVEVLEPKEWWQEYIDKEELDNINNSAKIFLLFEILRECEEIGDKVLVFSQSLYTLNCIEYFLQRIDEATQKGEPEKVGGRSGSWMIGLDYFRLDGSSSCDNRASWCDQFNDPDNTRARLFLISTKAGGLGINLVAANRVIIFDVSWNPSHDIQSIYRVYRFGQNKPSYIYRFVTHGAMEMKIYERQVTKQAISKRVIDEQQIDRHYSQNDIQELYKTDLEPTEERPIPLVPKDVLLGEMLQKHDKTIYKYHEHQSLLENKQDEELNEEERKAAWEEFENEKVVRKTTLTNFGGVNMGAFQNSLNFSPQLIQVALANIVRKDNPAWSEVQIRGILPALVTQLQMQMSENDFSMYNRVQQEIRLMQAIQAQRLRENYLKQYQLQQMQLLQKQQMANQMLGNLNVSPEELMRLQQAASQNYINPAAAAAARSNAAAAAARSNAGGSGDVIELND